MDGQDSGDTKQSTSDMTQVVQTLLQQMQNRFQTMSDSIVQKIDEMGDRINELEQSINDLRTEMGAEGSPSPLPTSKKPDDPKTEAVTPNHRQQPPPYRPARVADTAEFAVNQRNADAARACQQGRAQLGRFTPRRISIPAPVTRNQENETIETAILAPAMNFPPSNNTYPGISKFTPNAATILYYLRYMDFAMTSTRRWVENCGGWVPPISQIYISILFYVQIMRAMADAGILTPGSEIFVFMSDFLRLFPLESLWIPGPLVAAFKSIGAFNPSTSGLYGNVTPALPTSPGWSRDRLYCITNNHALLLPNISVFLSRLHSVIAAASAPNTNEFTFNNDVRGPSYIGQLFGHNCTHAADEILNLRSPGAKFAYGGNLQLWQDAAHFLPQLDIPANLDSAKTDVNDRWVSFLRLDEKTDWFSHVTGIMYRYCRFWRGSCPLSDCTPPTNSPAGGVICTQTAGNIFNEPEWSAEAGTRDSYQRGNRNQIGHYRATPSATLTFRTSCTIPDLPAAFTATAQTYNLNMVPDGLTRDQVQRGYFWLASPDVEQSRNVSVFEGVCSSIIRAYHSDVPINADHQ